jgi:predicted nucleic acid-binding protein
VIAAEAEQYLAITLESQCKTLYSEDLQDGQWFGNTMIKNSFAGI